MRIAAVQHDIVWEDGPATCERLEPQVAAAVTGGARLIVLTEMFATGFSMRTHLTAEGVEGPTVAWLHERAREHDVWLAASVPLRGSPGELPTNSLLIVGPLGIAHRYDKRHPFRYAGEHERFRPGDHDVVAEVEGVRLGLTVCYDLRFADQYWRMADGVDAYLVVANWPGARRSHWQALLRARAIENQAYVVGVNRVGRGGDLAYAGDSRVIDPRGEVIAAADGAEAILVADLDPEVTAGTRSRYPFLDDR